ncbi:MAG: glycosyltransferase [Acidobacteria bacterium]|nr:glycosyltransferase [Acidobacteriota bacterium]
MSSHSSAESIDIDNYRQLVGDALIDEILHLSDGLKGLRLCNINATASGGGVAELLNREVPIYRALGIEADWRIIHGDKAFFEITKSFHNALQGSEFQLTDGVRQDYLEHNRTCAELLEVSYDIYVVHDPQPAAIRYFHRTRQDKWVWRCHIDSSSPNEQVWEFLRPYIEAYDAAVFTAEPFRPPDLRMDRVAFIAPAIDPFATKNIDLPQNLCRQAIADSGVNLREPLLLQVSRFDPWKDPLGVIQVYRLVKKQRPGVQLALIGAMAGDDPEGWDMLETINAEATADPDLHVFTNLTGVGNMEVNVFQRGADLVIQKSRKEGFGLVVSEALWKEKAVVAGAAGGIPMQFPKGYHQYLVSNAEECAAKLLYLLDNPDEVAAFGRAGRERVRAEFLLPRLVHDQLKLIADLLERGGAQTKA